MGVWMTEEDAMERHSIKANLMRLYRNEAPPLNMHFETGRMVGAPMPYKQHRFVYVSQEGTKANYGDTTLLSWSSMCNYFSNNTIQTDAAADDKDTTTFRQHFEVYTTLKATPANITAAFEEGVMKRSDELQNKAPLRVPIAALAEEERTIRIKKLNQERNRKDQQYKRLMKKLEKYEELNVEEMSDEMLEMTTKSLQYATDNPVELRNDLARTIYELVKEEYDSIGGTAPLSNSEVESLVEALVDEIKNQCRMWNKQGKQCKYSSKLLGVAMSLYLRYEKTSNTAPRC
jgi:hypothetical protein